MPSVAERAGGDRGADVGDLVDHAGGRAHTSAGWVGLLRERQRGRLAHHQVGLDAEVAQQLQRAHAIDHAGGAGDPEHEMRRVAPLPRARRAYRLRHHLLSKAAKAANIVSTAARGNGRPTIAA